MITTPQTHTILAKSTNFVENTVTSDFTVQASAPCTATGYTADRLSIEESPEQYKYEIGVDPDLTLPFQFEIEPSSCAASFTKTYTISVRL